ncbi:hypothetical protein QEN19_004058 [Hanseniaspora menglaensis]
MNPENHLLETSTQSQYMTLNNTPTFMSANPSISFQPTSMVSGLSSFRFLNDITGFEVPATENTILNEINSEEVLNSKQQVNILEQENKKLQQKLYNLSQEHEKNKLSWEYERVGYEQAINQQNGIISSLTNCINSHLENEIKSREKLIEGVSNLRSISLTSVQSQTMTRSSEDNTPIFDQQQRRNSFSKISKLNNGISNTENNLNFSNINKGRLASDLIAQIVSCQQSIKASRNTTPLTIDKRIVEKHIEDMRSHSLPYNFGSCISNEVIDSESVYVTEKQVHKSSLLDTHMKPLNLLDSEELNNEKLGNFTSKDLKENSVEAANKCDEIKLSYVGENKQPEGDIIKSRVSNNADTKIPPYRFNKCPKTVLDVWNEFTKSAPGKLSILEMNSLYGAAWRRQYRAQGKQYSRRNIIYKAIVRGIEKKNLSLQECIQILENARIKYYNVETGEEIDSKKVPMLDTRKVQIKMKQKSVGWLTNHCNIPSKLQS